MTGPRWKGKGSAATALAEPMSKIVSSLQSSLRESKTHGILSSSNVLIEAGPQQTELFNRSCFGRPIITSQTEKQWFQLTMEEAFFLCHSLKCLTILSEEKQPMKEEDIRSYIKSKNRFFPFLYKAYNHLRLKNWVVRNGSQYGVDFVVYRHHPALVHSEYAVIVQLKNDKDGINSRLKTWSDLLCTLRVCGSVAKSLLVLQINNDENDDDEIEEYTISRWSSEQNRENHTDQRQKI